MEKTAYRAVAIVGVGAILPDAPSATTFWENITSARYSISEVTPDRWDPAIYFDPDPKAPDKTYSKIGGWVRDFEWDPVAWKLPIPPRVSAAMDDTQRWAVSATHQALTDYGYPNRTLDHERTAVILGNAMAGEKHYLTSMRVMEPEIAKELMHGATFQALPEATRTAILSELARECSKDFPQITEDTMPGELANCIAGRIANLFNFHGPNYVCDAACASAMAGISAAVEGLVEGDFDAVITGGIDRNMGVSTFVKFCKIGALSATGTRPYADGADGFVMGEGGAIFILKRLADAERDGDTIYAVIRGIAGASDGKGKGITAPNPVGQKLAIERAWKNAGLSPKTATLVEGHGTSTKVGDVVEVQSLTDVFGIEDIAPGSVALGSVKSNIGHLKGAAGAAGILKTAFALHHKVLPPSLNFKHPNPNIDFAHSPFSVSTELRDWPTPSSGIRRAGVSAFGFGGTNFHVVMEEYVPGRLKPAKMVTGFEEVPVPSIYGGGAPPPSRVQLKPPPRGALVVGAATEAHLSARLDEIRTAVLAGQVPPPRPPRHEDLNAEYRIAIDYEAAADLAEKIEKAVKAVQAKNPAVWKALRAQGVFFGFGPAPKVAFLYTGQGSQYVNMLGDLRKTEPIVAEVFAEADRVMTPLLGKPLTEFIFVDRSDPAAVEKAENDLRQTAITQPAVLAVDAALTKLMAAYGIEPDLVMGHSLGEYGALVSAGALPFPDALEAVSARGREMTKVSVADNGKMAAVFAPLPEIERILATIEGYAVIANLNSTSQAVIGGASEAIDRAIGAFLAAGFNAVPLPVSHAFHTSIVAPASDPLRQTLERLSLRPPVKPIVANVTGELYPMRAEARTEMLDLLARQVASPVQFVKGLHTLFDQGVRVFVEMGPKKALQGFVEDVLGKHPDVVALATNHPKTGDVTSFNQALCGLYAAGLGFSESPSLVETTGATVAPVSVQSKGVVMAEPVSSAPSSPKVSTGQGTYLELGKLFAEFLDRGMRIYQGQGGSGPDGASNQPVFITGAALGLPGTERIFDDGNIGRILRGQQFIDVIPTRFRKAMVEKHITRLVKSENGGPTFETIDNGADAIKLAARGGRFDLIEEFGIAAERLPALDIVTQLAIAAGIDALRDAGIPLVMHYKTTTKGTFLPDRWGLPDSLRDDTGIIFASAFPGYDSFASDLGRYYTDHQRRVHLSDLEQVRARLVETGGTGSAAVTDLDRRIGDLKHEIETDGYTFDRRFLFRVLAMGHSQFAELIGARGPNTHINSACASSTQAVALAQDWIRAGRCRRVVVVAADDVTSDTLLEWFGSGFLATGAAATDDDVEQAATPFDRRRHGMILGMGAAAYVIESAEAAAERAIQPICEVLSTVTANSAFHGTRLDVNHICRVMETLVAQAERTHGLDRHALAGEMVFVSHETYTPARGGSASAEIHALRHVFGASADKIIIANTKGFTGHPMGVGIEDVVAIKALETGLVPPVANFKEVDPELGNLNLSKGGNYPVRYAMRLGAGFGSQISLSLVRWIPTADGRRRGPEELGFEYRIVNPTTWKKWLKAVSGYETTEIETVHRTLRIKDRGPIGKVPAVVSQPVAQPSAPTAAVAAPPIVNATSVSVAPAVTARDVVKDRVLALVADKSGYPADMLDLDLDLEADLGIDTVKQAEIFAAVRESYGIQRDEKLKLRDFPTLARVIQFVFDKRPDLAREAESVSNPSVIQAGTNGSPGPAPGNEVRDAVLAVVSEKSGYPVDMLDLELDLEADLGIDTVKQAEIFAAVRGAYGIARDEHLKLRDFPTLGHVIDFVFAKRPDLKTTVAAITDAVTDPVPVVAENDRVRESVLAVVAQTSGYPIDMLDPELDLEADLGIDTVKQAEIFAAVRGEFGIPRDEHLKLRDFPTLEKVFEFVYQKRPDLRKTEVPAITAPAPAETIAVSGVAADSDDPIRAKVFEVVADKSGYPIDMLDPELDLEADLGIDTVKQAEIFAAVRGAYDIPRDESLKLRDFPTLNHVVQFVRDKRPDLAGKPAAASVGSGEIAAESRGIDLTVIPRRVAGPVLRPNLELFRETAVRLAAGDRVVVMPDQGGNAKAFIKKLKKRGVEALVLDGVKTREEVTDRISTWRSTGAIAGVYWLVGLDDVGEISTLTIDRWREALHVRLKLLHATMRALYDVVATPETFLVSATRLGGQHGYDEVGALIPLGGAVTGFVKAYKRERPDALVKAVDFAADATAADISETLIAETLADPGVVEIGHLKGSRWTVGLHEASEVDGQPGMALTKDSVFVVTGAAGSIVSAIVADLARASGGTFHLLDLVPRPDPTNADLARLTDDRDALKRDIFERLKAGGEKATPAMVEKELATLERARAALDAIQSVERAGGTARYHCVNLTDAKSVAAVIDTVRESHGKIDVLLHAAGIEISRFLPDKSPHEFDLVVDVKCDGWFNLMHAVGDMPLGATVAFSSIAGRFGNGGQTDYSSANDLLCKLTSHLRTTHPTTRGISIDWTAWRDIGMASRGSIPKMMELAGIDMLPPEIGIPFIRHELVNGGTRGETLVAGRLGVLMKEFDAESPGIPPERVKNQAAGRSSLVSAHAERVTATLHNGLSIDVTLDPKEQPFLFDHRIEGVPVLPGVMGIEFFLETARTFLPEWTVTAIEDVNFLAPFKFYRDEPRTLTLTTRVRPRNGQLLAECALTGSRKLPGHDTLQTTVHFTGRLILDREGVSRTAPVIDHQSQPTVTPDDLYRIYFHGPAYQVVELVWRTNGHLIGRSPAGLPANHIPNELALLASPRALELCFQTAGVWEMAMLGRMGLPSHIDRIELFAVTSDPNGVRLAAVQPNRERETHDAVVTDTAGNVILTLEGYRTVSLPTALDNDLLQPLRAAVADVGALS